MNFIILKSALKTEIGQGGVYQPPLNFGEAVFFLADAFKSGLILVPVPMDIGKVNK